MPDEVYIDGEFYSPAELASGVNLIIDQFTDETLEFADIEDDFDILGML